MRTHTLATLLFFTFVLPGSPLLYAATGDTTETEETTTEPISGGTILIQQTTPLEGIYSEWTLIKPGSILQTGRRESQYIEGAVAGSYTLIVQQLEGAVAEVKVYRNDELVSERKAQVNFTVADGDHIRIDVKTVLTRIGGVSVQSNPSGLSFHLKGPNQFEVTGTTPSAFLDVPEGLYTATFDEIVGCAKPRPISERLRKDSRITLSLTFSCEGMESNAEVQRNLQHVQATIDGSLVTFTDVPINTWFATYVHSALRTGIVSGYKDEDGHPTGLYGPTDNVTLAQLVKIAHAITAINVSSITAQPKNIRARDTWFSAYFASAEHLNWYVFRESNVDPNRNATRGEVVATLLQALDVPREWPKGNLFTDMDFDTPYCSSIETAARHGLISGYTDDTGALTGEFGPKNTINRAEMAKLITLAIEMYIENTPEIQGKSY